MNAFRRLLFTFILVGLLSATRATFAFTDTLELSAVGAVNFSTPGVSVNNSNVSTSGRTVFGFGGLASFPMAPLFRLESGVLYLPTSYSASGTNVTFNTLHVPILVEFTLLPFLSFGAGPYIGFLVGGLSSTTNNQTTTVSYDTANMSRFDFGLSANAALTLPIHPGMGILVDIRYLLGIKNLENTAGNSLKSSGFVILAGLTFSI
jgi:hypothetical protein